MKVHNILMSDKIQGFGYNASATDTFAISGFSVAAGSSTTRTVTMDIVGDTDTTSLTRIKISGTGFSRLDDKWLQIYGQLEARLGTGKPDIVLTLIRGVDTISFKIIYTNTSGSTANMPAHTLDAVVYLYSAPW